MNADKDKTENQNSNNETQSETAENSTSKNCCDRWRSCCSWKKCLGILLVLIVVFILGMFAGSLCAEYDSHYGFGMHSYHSKNYDEKDREKIAAKISKKVMKRASRKLSKFDVEEEQEAKINDILKKSINTNLPLVEKLHGQYPKFVELLTANSVDSYAVEQHRSEQFNVIEQISRNISSSLVEVAQTLTPEQRSEILEEWQEHKDKWHHDDDKN